MEVLRSRVETLGSAAIDGVSGATMTSNAVKTAVQKCIDQAMGEKGGDSGQLYARNIQCHCKGT